MSLAVYHKFHGYIEAQAPSIWEPAIVAGRLVEAMLIISHTSYGKPRLGYGNAWPATLVEFEDQLGRGAEARAEVWSRWASIRPQYDAAALSRAEDAAQWVPRYLSQDDGCSRVILAWATLRAARRPIQIEFKKRRCCLSTLRKKKSEGLQKISDGLNRDRIPIREAETGIE